MRKVNRLKQRWLKCIGIVLALAMLFPLEAGASDFSLGKIGLADELVQAKQVSMDSSAAAQSEDQKTDQMKTCEIDDEEISSGKLPVYIRTSGLVRTVKATIGKKEWINISGDRYLMWKGEYLTGWQQIDGKWYYLDVDGVMLSGWQQFGGCWYYLGDAGDGARKTGWQQIKGKWYYMDSYGIMQTGWQQIDGKWYYLKSDGSRAENAFVDGRWVDSSGVWNGTSDPGFERKGNAKLTFYDCSVQSNGIYAGRNSSGANGGNLTLGQVACSRSYIAPYTIIYIKTSNATGEGSYANGKFFYVADTGVSGAHVDICVPAADYSGRNYALGSAPYGSGRGDVYIVKENASWEEYVEVFFPQCDW